MRIGLIAENILERLALALGFVPTPLGETLLGSMVSQTIMISTKLGVFEALASSPLSAQEVAMCCDTYPSVTEKLLNVLVSTKLLKASGSRYSLSAVARKWLLKKSPQSLYDSMLLGLVEADLITGLEELIRKGKSLDIHAKISKSENSKELWSVYQQGMHSRAKLAANEVAYRTRVPKGARHMLDIGGSHGYYSVALCQRYPNLRSVILDLPDAVEQCAPIVAKAGMGNRVTHWAGNVLTADLGQDTYDLVFISQLVHHFDETSNRKLTQRIAQALRPGGTLVVQELIRRQGANQGGQTGYIMDLFFALTSDAGTWSFEEIASWQQDAGLKPNKPLWLKFQPSVGQQTAIKPS